MAQNRILSTTSFIDPYDARVSVRTFVVTPLETNSYAVVYDDAALVIDPGSAGAEIAHQLTGLKIKMIIATHGHGDHVSGVKALLDSLDYSVPFAVGEQDAYRLPTAVSNSNLGLPYDDDPPEASIHLREGDEIQLGDIAFKILNTPGHTEGGIVIYGAGLAFTGDTLFKGSAGRTDFHGGDATTLAESLQALKRILPAKTIILPGHGPSSTMEEELRLNPFLQ